MVSYWANFSQYFTELSSRHTSIFSFQDDNLSKYKWIFTKLGMYIGIVEVWFGNANGQSSSFYLPATCPYFRFKAITGVNISRFSPKLGMRIYIVEILLANFVKF